MILKITLVLSMFACCECVYVYSSFWAPLVDPRVLGYRVEARFAPGADPRARAAFYDAYGYRGENLIANLGNGRGPSAGAQPVDTEVNGDVKFYYTYPGAGRDQIH